jgi:WD40 repeat protein
MDRPFLSRRTAAIGVLCLSIALAVPVIAKSVAGADPSDVVPPVQPQHTSSAQTAQSPPLTPQRAGTRSVVYGTATKTSVTVYRQSLPEGSPEALFSYEAVPGPTADEPAWGIDDPETALSSDGRSVAYFARSGLRIRHLDTGADEVVIGRADPPPGGDRPSWTLDELNPPPGAEPLDAQWSTMYTLSQIEFSPDGRFLSFAGHWYEYRDHWVIDLATGDHWRDEGSSRLAWSPSSDRVAVAGPWYSDPGELAVSARGDFGRYGTIRPVPNPKPDASYEDVEFSPDGTRLAFTVSDRSWPSAGVRLATSKPDGTDFTEVFATTDPIGLAFAFSPSGDVLYSVGYRSGHLRLVGHDLAAGGPRELATLPANFAETVDVWVTPAGELALVVATPDEGHRIFQKRLFLYAPDGRLLEQSPLFDNATRFIAVD